MSQSRSAGSRHDWGTRLTRRPPLGEYAHATSAILGPSAGRDGLPAAPRGVVSGGRGQQPSVARPAGLPADPAAPPPHVVAHPSQARRSGPDLRGWEIRRVSELLRAQPGGRLRADLALSALRRRVRDRVVGLTLAGLRSAPGATATWQAGARPRGGAARARHGVRPASVKDKSVKDK